MLRLLLLICATACFGAAENVAETAPPVPLIYDTDIGNDVDDALALGVIHALESRGEDRERPRVVCPICRCRQHVHRRLESLCR